MGEYPEHEKMKKVSANSLIIGEFLEWLTGPRKRRLAEENPHRGDYYEPDLIADDSSIEELLAEYYRIDLKKLEKEKRQMLEEFNEQIPRI